MSGWKYHFSTHFRLGGWVSVCLESSASDFHGEKLSGEMRNVFFRKPQKKKKEKQAKRARGEGGKILEVFTFFHHRRHHHLHLVSSVPESETQVSSQLKITNLSDIFFTQTSHVFQRVQQMIRQMCFGQINWYFWHRMFRRDVRQIEMTRMNLRLSRGARQNIKLFF